MIGRVHKCPTCRKYTRHMGDTCVVCEAKARPAPTVAHPPSRWALARIVGAARADFIAACRKDVVADFGEEKVDSWAGEVECGQHDYSLPDAAQRAARVLGCFGRALPLD